MSMELVNGVLCLNCSDVERAKKAGLSGSTNTPDPLHPSTVVPNRGDPSSARDTSSASGAASSAGDAFSQNGTSTSGSSAVTPASAPVLGVNQPLSSGDRGTQLNLLL